MGKAVPLVIDMSKWDTWALRATEFRDVMARFADAEAIWELPY